LRREKNEEKKVTTSVIEKWFIRRTPENLPFEKPNSFLDAIYGRVLVIRNYENLEKGSIQKNDRVLRTQVEKNCAGCSNFQNQKLSQLRQIYNFFFTL